LLYGRVFVMQVLEVMLEQAERAGDTARQAILWQTYDSL
jgi:hypothetical protein